jgi:hypothetical protein
MQALFRKYQSWIFTVGIYLLIFFFAALCSMGVL